MFKKIVKLTILASTIIGISGCGLYKPVDMSKEPSQAPDRAKKNISEGKGISLGNLGKRKTTYEFSTSNPMWRASLEILDFLPLSTVDYSGGLIITDWYSDNDNQSIKITLRFLTNEIRSDSLKITVHQKNCNSNNICKTKLIKSKVAEELARSILTTAAKLDKK